MQIIPMRELKNTVEIERRCAEENGPVPWTVKRS